MTNLYPDKYFDKLYTDLKNPDISDYAKADKVGKAIIDIIFMAGPVDYGTIKDNADTIACALNCAINLKDPHMVMSDLCTLRHCLKA